MSETLIDLIRHGEPVGGRAFRGHNIDDPLSDKGWQQMWDAVGEHHPWQYIISSPMLRCQAFAEALSQRHGIPFDVDPRLREVGFGSWEGRTPQQIQQTEPQQYADFYRDPVHCRPPGAELIEGFIARVSAAYAQVLEDHAGKHCLIVSHAGVMRAIIATLLEGGAVGMYRIMVDNAGISRIRHGEYGGKLEFHNGHLPAEV